MNKMTAAVFLILVFAMQLDAEEIKIPAGTRIEGVILNGIYAVQNSSPFFAIKASKYPVDVGGNEIPIRDCIVLGDIFADMVVKRAIFKATKITCSNAKEPDGVRISGYAIDGADNELGITGIVDVPPEVAPAPGTVPQPGGTEAAPRFIEIKPGKKVFLLITDGVSITIK